MGIPSLTLSIIILKCAHDFEMRACHLPRLRLTSTPNGSGQEWPRPISCIDDNIARGIGYRVSRSEMLLEWTSEHVRANVRFTLGSGR
jgi:hypothetical protein